VDHLFTAFPNPEQPQYVPYIGFLSLVVGMLAAQRQDRFAIAAAGVGGARRGLGFLTLALVVGLALAGPVGQIAGTRVAMAQTEQATLEPVDVLVAYKPEDVVQLAVVRGDEQLTLPVTLGSRPST
jgi:hypothetical protein